MCRAYTSYLSSLLLTGDHQKLLKSFRGLTVISGTGSVRSVQLVGKQCMMNTVISKIDGMVGGEAVPGGMETTTEMMTGAVAQIHEDVEGDMMMTKMVTLASNCSSSKLRHALWIDGYNDAPRRRRGGRRDSGDHPDDDDDGAAGYVSLSANHCG